MSSESVTCAMNLKGERGRKEIGNERAQQAHTQGKSLLTFKTLFIIL